MVKLPSFRSSLPPLENGDRLTRDEFERRYNAMPNVRKAELIEGVVYRPAALRFRSHGQPHSWMIAWLVAYEAGTPGVAVGDAPTVRLDLDNEPQPDAVLLLDADVGGQTRLSQDDYIEGAPELIVEIAASSVAIDLHDKKHAYRRNGVKEYIVWQVLDQTIRWFYLDQGKYLDLPIDTDGILRSRVFPGLWLAVDELLAGNLQRVLAVVQAGVQSSDHEEFVQQLGRCRGGDR